MGRLYLPNEREIIGPWLLGIHEFEMLEELLSKIYDNLKTSHDRQVESNATSDFRSGKFDSIEKAFARHKSFVDNKRFFKRITLSSEDGRTLVDESLKNILIDPALHGFKPASLDCKVQCGVDNKFTLSIVEEKDGYLNYKISCFDDDIENEIRYLIENWIQKNQPHKAKQIWNKYAGGIGFIAFWPFFIYSLSITGDNTDYKQFYKNQIKELLATGISQDNQTKAIELLLKLSIEYQPPTSSNEINVTALKIAIITLFILIVCVFYPKTVLGLGKYTGRLTFYRNYSTFVIFTIPTLFLITPFYEWIRYLLTI